MSTSPARNLAVALLVGLCACAPTLLRAQAVAKACADYDGTTTPVDINITESGVTKPSAVQVDTGEWVYFADNTVSKIVRFTGRNTTPVFENIGGNAYFGSISGICLSPQDQSLFATDLLNNTLFVIPCVLHGQPANPKTGPYCKKYADYHGVFDDVPLSRPTQCAVDKGGNIFVTQNSPDLVIINQSNFSYSVRTIPDATLGPVAVDLTDFDVYLGDSVKSTLYRLPCNQVDATGTQCMSLDSSAAGITNPNPAPVTIRMASGLALNRGDGTGDFDLLVSDSTSAQVVSISHPKSSTKSSGTTLTQMLPENAPADIALDPILFDVVIAEPKYALQTAGALERLVCTTEVYAPSPAVTTTAGPRPTPTTTSSTSSTTAGPTGMSPGSVFLLLLFLALLVYFGGGAIFLRVTTQRFGVPNEQMWRNLMGLVTDGFYFAFCCGRRPAGHVPYDGGKLGGAGSARNSTSPRATTTGRQGDDDLISGPKYENYDAMHDDL